MRREPGRFLVKVDAVRMNMCTKCKERSTIFDVLTDEDFDLVSAQIAADGRKPPKKELSTLEWAEL